MNSLLVKTAYFITNNYVFANKKISEGLPWWSSGVQWLSLCAPSAGAQIQSLVGN